MSKNTIIGGKDRCDYRAMRTQELIEEATYAISLPLSGIVALQMQAGLDGFLEIEKALLVRRGIFSSARRRGPIGWSLDAETSREVDRLFARLSAAVAAHRQRCTPESCVARS